MWPLIGIIVVFLAIAPSVMAGGRCIASFMARKGMVGSTILTAACLLALVIGAVLALQVAPPSSTEGDPVQRLFAALVFASPTWIIYWLGTRWLDKAQ